MCSGCSGSVLGVVALENEAWNEGVRRWRGLGDIVLEGSLLESQKGKVRVEKGKG